MNNRISAAAAIFLIILIAGCVDRSFEKEFAGQTLHFRANLNEAKEISVYPNETALKDTLYNPYTRNIIIAMPNNTDKPAFYLAAAYELAYKIVIVYKYYEGDAIVLQSSGNNKNCLRFNATGRSLCIETLVSDDLNLAGFDVQPVILMLGPPYANQTAVTVKDYLITVEGKSFDETNRQYTDLDLAVDKLLLVLMNQ